TGGLSTVNYTTQASSATTPADFQSASNTLNFAAGEDTKDVTVHIVGDNLQESTELFFLNLNPPQNGTIIGGSGQATIVDDDLSFIAISDVTVLEGNGPGATTATFTIVRFGATGGA